MKSCITISLVEEARGGPFVLWGDLYDCIKTAASLGYDGVEIFPPGPEAINVKKLGPFLTDHGLKLAAVGTGAGWVRKKLHLADESQAKRRDAIDFIRSIIDVAGPLGASTIIGSMQGRHEGAVSKSLALGYLQDALQTLGEYSGAYNLPLFYEPLNRYETNQVNTVAAGVELLQSLSTQHVKLLCDLFHMNIEEQSIAESLRSGGNHVGHIHFVDSNRRAVGWGHIALNEIFSSLNAIGYRGYLSAEALSSPNPMAAAEQTMRAFRYWTGS